ncbi:efflux RND transporter periplasmic adaptor subunit [Laspinema olomoucense]|uniref:efflux RND transporter periplasmic adaptor subunit n=1 Tax=Laspinema olomoucense TaxID=3231600 RepID=UPI0021BAD763|nr:efflux RND transporter periplasmic adaptor subunit [Laspinema sp. D3c]MCT7995750.1 efflux RND transporter periplasmic adaptor subunit [Laspinema sp. D3c]
MLSQSPPSIRQGSQQQRDSPILHDPRCRSLGNSMKTGRLFFCMAIAVGLFGCPSIFNREAEGQPATPGGSRERQRGPSTPSVEVAVARTETLGEPLVYSGNTEPFREVSVRAQTEGRLLDMTVDLGDRVEEGEILAQLDGTLLEISLGEAEAELAARESDVVRARNEVRNAQIQVDQALVELQQAQKDAERFLNLAAEGAVSRQQGELAQTAAEVAAQTVRSAREQILIEQESVRSAEQLVKAQRSVVAQARERRSYAFIRSPITGVVLDRLTEPGNLVQPGGDVLKLGDFSQVKAIVPVAELALAEIRVGQAVTVSLDALGGEVIEGRVSRISPVSNVETRQIPVEVTIPNPDGRIVRGLLARVTFDTQTTERVVIPENALQGEDKNTVFVLREGEGTPTVEARTVQIGERLNNQVEILSGLGPGERYVTRSSRPLSSGDEVRLSALSES